MEKTESWFDSLQGVNVSAQRSRGDWICQVGFDNFDNWLVESRYYFSQALPLSEVQDRLGAIVAAVVEFQRDYRRLREDLQRRIRGYVAD